MPSFVQTLGRPLQRLFVVSRRVHVSQAQSTRLDPAPLARVDKFHPKFRDSVGNLSHSPCQRGRNRRKTFAVIYGRQRLDPAHGSWNDGLRARLERTRKQLVEPFCRKVRQVAGDDQIPARMCRCQSGGDSGHRPIPEYIRPIVSLRVVHVRDRVQPERSVSAWRSDNGDLGDEWLKQAGCIEDQRDAAKIEKSLIVAHARAGAPYENKPGDLAIALHECPAILRLRSELAQRSGEL
jgi:hypothetical protein